MIAIILGIAAIIILSIWLRGDDEDEQFVRHVAVAGCCILVVIIDLVVFGIYANTAIEVTQTTEVIATTKLVAIRDNTSATGEFFLGSGNLENESYYTYYYETEYGYKHGTLHTEDKKNPVYIQYISADNETPRIDQYSLVEHKTMAAKGSNAWLFSIIAWLNYNQYDEGDLISEEPTDPTWYSPFSKDPNDYDNWRYEIYIPEGSIKTDYTIDLE